MEEGRKKRGVKKQRKVEKATGRGGEKEAFYERLNEGGELGKEPKYREGKRRGGGGKTRFTALEKMDGDVVYLISPWILGVECDCTSI